MDPKQQADSIACEACTEAEAEAEAETETESLKVSAPKAIPPASLGARSGKRSAQNRNLIAVFASVTMLWVVFSVMYLGGSSNEARDAAGSAASTHPEAKTPTLPKISFEKPAEKPVVDVNPAIPEPTPSPILRSPAEAPKPVDIPEPEETAQPAEAPKLVDTPEPKETVQPVETPKPATAESDLVRITDVHALRERIRDLGAKAPRDQIIRLGAMPGPDEPEKTAYVAKFSKNNPDRIGADYDSKIVFTDDKGEPAVKVADGGNRLACYFRPGPQFSNRMRARMRIYQQGLKKMQLSVVTVNGIRFDVEFEPPAEGQWADINVDCGSTTAKGIKLSNMSLKHIEVHGFRKGDKKGAFFELSRFDIVTGGNR